MRSGSALALSKEPTKLYPDHATLPSARHDATPVPFAILRLGTGIPEAEFDFTSLPSSSIQSTTSYSSLFMPQSLDLMSLYSHRIYMIHSSINSI